VAGPVGSYEVIEILADVTLWRGITENIRSDNVDFDAYKGLKKPSEAASTIKTKKKS
jgi:hypothetical protein